MPKVLLIDDDVRLRELVSEYLTRSGFVVLGASDGETGLARLAAESVDAILLDGMLPGIDGLEVLRRVRARSTIPVLMLTARGEETDRVVGLEIGADDYIAKPFSPRELLARLRAVLRRASPEGPKQELRVGGLVLDVGAREVHDGGARVDVTGLEFDLLAALVRRAGRVVPRDTLLQEAGRGDAIVSDRTVDVHISHLRQKLNDDPRSPRRIKTIRGVGYLFAREEP